MQALSNIVSEVKNFVKGPFVGTVTPLTLFLATGMVLIFIFLWMLILYHIRMAAETVL